MEQQFQPPRGSAAGTQVIDRAAHLLTLVLDSDRPRGLVELALAAELPKSTASRLLSALERQGLVEQRGDRGPFGPGPVILRLAQRGMVDRQLAELAQPHLTVLSDASGETVNLAVPTLLGVEHLAQVESRHFLGTGQWVGRRVPFHATAVGKVLVAFGAARMPEAPLDRIAPKTITDPVRFAEVVATVRRDGYATALDELEDGLSSLAAPVLGGDGVARAALSISGPSLRLDVPGIADLRPVLIHEAQALTARLSDHEKGVQAA
jgi:IclR family acetate operon transcriptional repressor